MQIDTTKETHDSSTTLWIAMFDSAASLVRSIAGTLKKCMHRAWYYYQQCGRIGDYNSNMSVNCTKPWLVLKIA